MIEKPFDAIGKADIDALIENAVGESRTLEYKREMPNQSDKDRKEFLADISSFGNAAGGDILYGVKERVDANGIQAYEAVPISKGGRGKKSGLSEYAEKVGKDNSNVVKIRDAGEVCKNLGVDTRVFLGWPQHLSASYKLPKGCWPADREDRFLQTKTVRDVSRKGGG